MSLWAITTSADVSLSAATAKTVLGFKAPSNAVITLRNAHINFESVTASDAVALIELVKGSADGTGTSETPINYNGAHTASCSFTAKHTYTVEPASLTVIKAWQYPVQGSADIPLPFFVPITSAAGGFIGFRVTTPQAQSCRISADVED